MRRCFAGGSEAKNWSMSSFVTTTRWGSGLALALAARNALSWSVRWFTDESVSIFAAWSPGWSRNASVGYFHTSTRDLLRADVLVWCTKFASNGLPAARASLVRTGRLLAGLLVVYRAPPAAWAARRALRTAKGSRTRHIASCTQRTCTGTPATQPSETPLQQVQLVPLLLNEDRLAAAPKGSARLAPQTRGRRAT